MRVPLAVMLLASAGCSLSPLQNRIHPGEEPFVVVVGTGADQKVDLFATLPGGGEVHRLTFTAMVESSPRLSGRGDVVAFLRHGTGSGRAQGEVVVMNLLNGAERHLDVPDSAGTLRSIGWSDDERHLFLTTDNGHWMVDAPPVAPNARRIPPALTATADSALNIWLGTPRFARVEPCATGGICIAGPSGEPRELSGTGQDAARWGSDSVAWLEGDQIVIRPLGPGPMRRLDLDPKRVTALTGLTYATP